MWKNNQRYISETSDYSLKNPDYSLIVPDYSLETPDYSLKALDYSLEVRDHSSVMIDCSLEIVDFSPAGPDLNIKYKEAHMAHSDWVPTREQDLVDLAERWEAGLSDAAKQAAFGWDATECANVVSKITAFLTARTAYEMDNSTANRIAKDETKGEMVDIMRDFANSSIRFNKKMRDEDKLIYGIRPADTTPTYHGTPTSQPDTDVENTHNHFEHRVRAINHERGDTSKPADAYGVRYAWQIGGEKPASGADLPKSKFSRKTTHIVQHTEADKGKTVYYATCYENGRGDNGSWSPIEEAIIG